MTPRDHDRYHLHAVARRPVRRHGDHGGDGDGDVGRRVWPGPTAAAGLDRGHPDHGDLHGRRSTAASCTPATPVAPTVVQATCTNGVVTVPTITPATHDRRHLHAGARRALRRHGDHRGDGDGDVGRRVRLGPSAPTRLERSHLHDRGLRGHADGRARARRRRRWRRRSSQATCTNGAVTAPTITPATTTGVTYTARRPPGPYVGTVTTVVTVTATLAAGSGWARPLPTGWTEVTPTTATFQVTLTAASCTPVDTGGPDGRAGDVHRWCGDRADDHAGHHGGCDLHPGVRRARTTGR